MMGMNNPEGGNPVRRIIRYLLLGLAALLLALGVYHGTRRAQPSVTVGTGSAALGLMLLDEPGGVYVLAVTEDSPADASGVQPGDYLLRAGEETLTSAESLDALLEGMQESIALTLRRNNAEITVILPGK